jgi:hypothetical protein
MTKKGKGKGKKTSLMGVPLSRSPKYDMAKILTSQDIDGVAEYNPLTQLLLRWR